MAFQSSYKQLNQKRHSLQFSCLATNDTVDHHLISLYVHEYAQDQLVQPPPSFESFGVLHDDDGDDDVDACDGMKLAKSDLHSLIQNC